jgi:hypothetical protein
MAVKTFAFIAGLTIYWQFMAGIGFLGNNTFARQLLPSGICLYK